jgi:hypothetical protein
MLSLLIKSLSVFATIVVTSSDLGLDYSWLEEAVYQNFIIQIVLVGSLAYAETDNLIVTLVITTIWLLLKYVPKYFTTGKKESMI